MTVDQLEEHFLALVGMMETLVKINKVSQEQILEMAKRINALELQIRADK